MLLLDLRSVFVGVYLIFLEPAGTRFHPFSIKNRFWNEQLLNISSCLSDLKHPTKHFSRLSIVAFLASLALFFHIKPSRIFNYNTISWVFRYIGSKLNREDPIKYQLHSSDHCKFLSGLFSRLLFFLHYLFIFFIILQQRCLLQFYHQ